jgi:hypothetical protein
MFYKPRAWNGAKGVWNYCQIPKTQHALIRSTCHHAFTQTNDRSVEVRNIVGSMGFCNGMRRATSGARLGMGRLRRSWVSRLGLGLGLGLGRSGCMIYGCGVLRRGRRQGKMRTVLTEPPRQIDRMSNRGGC